MRPYRWLLLVPTLVLPKVTSPPSAAFIANETAQARRWIGTWSTAPQPHLPLTLRTFHNQTLRLIVHTTAGGSKVRIRISNTYGDLPLQIGAARIARRTTAADIDPTSRRTLTYRSRPSTTIPGRSIIVSDPVELTIPALSDQSDCRRPPSGSDKWAS